MLFSNTAASLNTSSMDLAAALSAMGVNPLRSKQFDHFVGDSPDGERWIWYFENQSNDGKYTATELIAAWYDKSFIDRNPEHPFSYIMAAFENRKWLLAQVKGHVPIAVLTGKYHTALIPLNLPKDKQDKILKRIGV